MSDLLILDELRADLDAAFARRERRRWTLPASGALAVAAAAAAAVFVSSGASPPATSAAEALRRVAHVAAGAPAPVPRDDQFYYVHTLATNLSMFAGRDPAHAHAASLVEADRRIWLSISRPGRLVEHRLGTVPLTAPDSARSPDPDVAVPQGLMSPRQRYLIGDEQLTRAQLLAYPTDPHVIFDRLRARVGNRGHSPDGEVFTEIGDALRESPAPPALRAGLYGALALVPGVSLVGPVRDRAGRTGTAVAFTEVGVRSELIFNPGTSELLAEREVLVDPVAAEIDAPAGTVIGDAAYLERAVTDQPE